MKHPITGLELLHRHSDFSLLDGYGTVAEYAERSKEINQQFLCITDHGVMGAIPQQIMECEKHKLHSLFGIELYVNPLQPKVNCRAESAEFRKTLDPDQQKKFEKSNHLLAIAYNLTGYSNLVRMSSWAWIHGFYKKPRVNHEVLNQYKEGIIFSSCCAISEVASAFFEGGDEAGFKVIEKYMAMFEDKFYLELMMLDFKLQKPYDAFILRAAEKYHLPLIMTTDTHYCKKEESHNQQLMLMQKGKRNLANIQDMIDSGEAEDLFELQDKNLWMKSEDEMNEKWESDYKDIIDYELYKQAKENTVKLANFAKGVKFDREIKLPKIPDADEKLWHEVLKGFKYRNCPKNNAYISRLKEEYELIKEKEFSSYFLIQKMMTDEARRYCKEQLGFGEEYGVSSGRGSIGGSLLAYCLRLHDMDPILHDLRFSRFLSPARGGKQTKFRHTITPVSHEDIAT